VSRRERSSRARCSARTAIIGTRSRTGSRTCFRPISNELGLRRDDACAVLRPHVGVERLAVKSEELSARNELREDRPRFVLAAKDDERRRERLDGGQDERFPVIHRVRGQEVREGARSCLGHLRKFAALPRDVDDGESAAFRTGRVGAGQGAIALRRQEDRPARESARSRDERHEPEPFESAGGAPLRVALSGVVGQQSDCLHGVLQGLMNSAYNWRPSGRRRVPRLAMRREKRRGVNPITRSGIGIRYVYALCIRIPVRSPSPSSSAIVKPSRRCRSGWCAGPAAAWSCKSSGCRHSWTRDAANLSTAAFGRNRNTRYVRASALGLVMKNRPVGRRTRRTSRNNCAGSSTCSRTSVATTASNASSWNGNDSALAKTIRTRSAVPGLRLDPLARTADTRSGRRSIATTSRPALSERVRDNAP